MEACFMVYILTFKLDLANSKYKKKSSSMENPIWECNSYILIEVTFFKLKSVVLWQKSYKTFILNYMQFLCRGKAVYKEIP